MEYYKEYFSNIDQRSQLIDNQFAKINNEIGYNEAIDYLKSIGAKWVDIGNYHILYAINMFTKSTVAESFKKELFDNLLCQDDVIDIKQEYNEKFKVMQTIICKKQVSIKLIKFSEILPKAKNLFSDLENDNRVGTCFLKAYHTSLNLGIPNKIVTGFVYGYCDKSQFLHSWIETNIGGEDVVIDGTLNAIINRDGYYHFRHVEPICIIENEVFKSDIENYWKDVGSVPLPLYFVCRDEIINDFKKNSLLFDSSKILAKRY